MKSLSEIYAAGEHGMKFFQQKTWGLLAWVLMFELIEKMSNNLSKNNLILTIILIIIVNNKMSNLILEMRWMKHKIVL